MDYKETNLNFLYDDLVKDYGEEKGKKLYLFMCEKYTDLCGKEIQYNAHNAAEENSKLAKIPFTYGLFKLFAKSHMKKRYPSEGFVVKWRRHDDKEVHFDIVKCIYKDMCEKYGIPELCTVFCQSDITAFAGYAPKIRFERLGTIGEGADCCDFHFIRGNAKCQESSNN